MRFFRRYGPGMHWIAKKQTTIDCLPTNAGWRNLGPRDERLKRHQEIADKVGWRMGELMGPHQMRIALGDDKMSGHRRAIVTLVALGSKLPGNVFRRVR